MIRITVELLSARTGERKILGVMDICNTGTGTDKRGNYVGRLYRRGSTTTTQRIAKVENYPRASYSVWVLVKKMLQEMFDGKS